jgi:hypothetical protein
MSASSLDPRNLNRPDRQIGKGHGTAALGPSDTSDSGSDLQGGDGLAQQGGMGFDSGTTSGPDVGTARNAGPHVGDANLDSDSDSSGTGETASAGSDSMYEDGADIDTDHIEEMGEEIGEEFSEGLGEEISAEGIEGSDDDADSDDSLDMERPDGGPRNYQFSAERISRGRLH